VNGLRQTKLISKYLWCLWLATENWNRAREKIYGVTKDCFHISRIIFPSLFKSGLLICALLGNVLTTTHSSTYMTDKEYLA
jgi:hypothetical protein